MFLLLLFLCFFCESLADFDPTKHENWNLVDHERCGNSMAFKIIGGTNASLGEFTWIVRIGYYLPASKNISYRCGGAILNEHTILTAAHCVTHLPNGVIFPAVAAVAKPTQWTRELVMDGLKTLHINVEKKTISPYVPNRFFSAKPQMSGRTRRTTATLAPVGFVKDPDVPHIQYQPFGSRLLTDVSNNLARHRHLFNRPGRPTNEIYDRNRLPRLFPWEGYNNNDLERVAIEAGEYDASSDPDCQGGVCAEPVQIMKPRELIYHSEYNKIPFKNDIALIRLETPIKFNAFVSPICLMSGHMMTKNYVGTVAQVAGWGIYDIKKPMSSIILQKISMKVVDNERCKTDFLIHAQIGPTQMCVGGEVGKDSCGGDSGGPLVQVNNVDGFPKTYVIGVVSFGNKRCGIRPMPGVYTRLTDYMEWILNNLKRNTDNCTVERQFL